MTAFSKIKRVTEIGKVLVKHGLAAYLPQPLLNLLRIEKQAAGAEKTEDIKIEKEIRAAFEELGTTFIKLGQLMSLRSDVVPASMANEFKKLTDNVKPMDFAQIKPIIEQELGAKISDIFSEFDETAIATASISQVYGAVLKETGEEVVVKVRKPGIVETIRSDMDIILSIAGYLDNTKYAQSIDFKGIAEEFFWSMNQELDFVVERSNNEKFLRNFADPKWSWIFFPKMYSRYCTGQILVMEKIHGLKLDQMISSGNPQSYNRKTIAERGAEAIMQMVLVDGFFNADLHEGNIFFKENNGIAIIDSGMCGTLNKYMKNSIADLMIAFAAKDWGKVAKICLEISEGDKEIDTQLFVNDIHAVFESIPDNFAEINSAEIVQKLSAVVFRHKLKIPRELTLFIRSLSMIEGLCRKLDSDFELMKVADKLSKEILVQRITPENVAENALDILTKSLDTLQTLPPALTNIAEKLESGTIQHRFLVIFGDSERKFISKMVTRTTCAFIMTGSLISCGFLRNSPMIWIAYLLLALSFIIFVMTFRKNTK